MFMQKGHFGFSRGGLHSLPEGKLIKDLMRISSTDYALVL